MINLKDIKVGETTVWVQEHWSGAIESGTVTEILYTKPNERYPEPIPYVNIKLNRPAIGSRDCSLKDAFTSKEEIVAYLNQKTEKYKADIKAQIHSVTDLVKFMYDNTVSSADEYTDWDARSAVREIAKDMLDIDLGE